MKALLLLAALFPMLASAKEAGSLVVTAPMEGQGHLQCFVQEIAGRRSEKYEVRLSIPTKRAGEFALKLFPLLVVHVEAWVDNVPGSPLEINATLIDNAVEEADLLWDLILARAKGEERVSLYSKLGPSRKEAVRIECGREEAVERAEPGPKSLPLK